MVFISMKIIITEKQFLKSLDMLFNTMYGNVRYKKDKSRLSVYKGDKLRRTIGSNDDGSWKLPTYIMEYYPNDESLWISDFVYTEMKKYFPPISDNMLFFDFFKKWFIDKFGITPKKVYIFNQGSLSDKYNNEI
jgi:hypothetical protein